MQPVDLLCAQRDQGGSLRRVQNLDLSIDDIDIAERNHRRNQAEPQKARAIGRAIHVSDVARSPQRVEIGLGRNVAIAVARVDIGQRDPISEHLFEMDLRIEGQAIVVGAAGLDIGVAGLKAAEIALREMGVAGGVRDIDPCDRKIGGEFHEHAVEPQVAGRNLAGIDRKVGQRYAHRVGRGNHHGIVRLIDDLEIGGGAQHGLIAPGSDQRLARGDDHRGVQQELPRCQHHRGHGGVSQRSVDRSSKIRAGAGVDRHGVSHGNAPIWSRNSQRGLSACDSGRHRQIVIKCTNPIRIGSFGQVTEVLLPALQHQHRPQPILRVGLARQVIRPDPAHGGGIDQPAARQRLRRE